MPEVLTALAAGRISPLGASIAVRETACLTRDDRHRVSRELAVAGGLSDRELEVATRRRVQELDLEAAVRRAAKAREDRYVSIRPEPDAVARLSAVLPVEQCVAVYASLRKAAESAHATGDERAKAQLMADTLVERVTGQALARMVPVEIAVVMTSDALLGRTDEPAHLPGYGPIPARVVRQLATDGVVETVTDDPSAPPDVDIPATEAEKARVWIRRMLTDPVDGTVTDIDSRRRRFNRSAATFIRLRDQVCRDPHCDAPIRDLDHLHDYADGGRTTIDNGIGLCQRGNLVDQVPGWHIAGTSRQRIIVTPTGHRYESRPPPALGPRLPVVDRAAELPSRRLIGLPTMADRRRRHGRVTVRA